MGQYLVTGGAGFIGSHIVHGLIARGDRVRVLDNFSTGKRANLADVADRVEVIEGDLRNPGDCARACQGVNVVFHEGALPSVPKSVEDPLASHQANVDGTFNLLLAARDAHVRRVVYAASSSAYGDAPSLPKLEDMAPSPLSPYAVNKLVGEYYCRVFSECFGLQTVSLRYFNVFGPRQDPKSQYAAAIPAFVTHVLRGTSPIVYGDGEQTRDFTYVDNIVHANLLAADAPQTHGEVLNIACGERISVNQIIGVINRVLGKSVQPTYAPVRAGDVKHSLADISLARKVIKFSPIVDFEKGLELAINWYKNNLG